MESALNGADGQVISVFLRRTKDGVQVNVHAAPEVEEFFRRWGGGRRDDVRAVGGRLWRMAEGQPTSFWIVGSINYGNAYMLNQPGTALVDEDDRANISFLQLEGISEGRTFTCDMVLSRSELERVSKRISQALGAFYNDYIKPASMQVVVSTKQAAPNAF